MSKILLTHKTELYIACFSTVIGIVSQEREEIRYIVILLGPRVHLSSCSLNLQVQLFHGVTVRVEVLTPSTNHDRVYFLDRVNHQQICFVLSCGYLIKEKRKKNIGW